MNRRIIATACGAALLIAAAVVVALRERQSVPLPEVPVAQTPAEVRVKAVERKVEPMERIREREDIGTPTAGKEASLTLRPLLRAVQPHEIRSDSFGGLGCNPRDKSSNSIVNNLRSNSAKRNFVTPSVSRKFACDEVVRLTDERSEELSRSESRKSPSAFPWPQW